MSLKALQTFCFGVAVATGCISWLSVHFDGIGHVPRAVELPGIAFASFLDRVPEALATSIVWPSGIINRLEGLLDNYQCPGSHEYRLEIVNHSPVILRLGRFLPPGEAAHLLRLADERSTSTSYVSEWTVDDPTRLYLEPDEDRVVACLEARIANVSGYSIHHQEAIQIVRNSGSRGAEHPDANLWPEWQPYDTTPTKRAARMMIALTTASSGNWDIEFPALKKTVSLQKSDALFWWNLSPNGTFDERITHKIATKEKVLSANIFINEGLWRPSWWEAS